VWWADLDPQIGREQAVHRPVIVVGSPLACTLPNGLALVVPCTTTDRRLRFQPRIELDGHACFAMCDQVKALSIDRLTDQHQSTVLDLDFRSLVRRAIRAMLA
jgi:mRNA interferase MazF